MALSSDRQRERLKGLMLVRVVIVTAFLGSTLAVDLTALGDFDDLRNRTLVALIVGTYVLTILYAVAFRQRWSTSSLANAQLSGDLLVTTILVLATGGFDSVFVFFFYLTIINAAVVIGQRGALITAAVTAACMAFFATVVLGWVPQPFGDELRPMTTTALVYQFAINSLAGFLIAFLAGHLADRLGRATEELQARETDIQDLRVLNENILSSLSSGLLTVDDRGTIIFFNRAAEEITGLAKEEVLGNPLDALFPGLAAATDAFADGAEPRHDSLFERPDGTQVYLGFSLSPLRDHQGESGQIIIFQDLTEIRKMEAQVKRSQHLAAIGQLSAAIAHEIRNPLASISGSVEMLRMDANTSDEDRTLMDIVVREVDRLDGLITDFLAYTQPRPLQRKVQPLLPLVQEVLRLFQNTADQKDIHLHPDLSDAPTLTANIDAEALRQVLWNLLQNATQAQADLPPEDRHIRIELQAAPGSPDLLLAVEDNGPGVPLDHHDRIFEPFFTTKHQGTGLGLATTYRLLEAQDARITLTAPHHHNGARFEIHLRRTTRTGPLAKLATEA